MKIRPVGAELFRADGQTDMAKLIVALRNFMNASESKNMYHAYEMQTHKVSVQEF